MKLFSKKPLAVATAVALGLGMAGAAHAGALAFSNLNILNLKVFDFATSTQITSSNVGSYFTKLAVSNIATNTAILNGVGTDVQATGPTAGGIPSKQACVGTNCGSVSGFSQTAGFPPGSQGNFERADSELVGTILDTAGANARAVAESQLPNPGAGQSNANVGTSTGFTFTAVAGVPLQFTFDTTGDLVATLLADSAPGSVASASIAYSITLKDLTTNTTILDFAPGALNTSRSVTNPPTTGTSTYPDVLCGSPPCNLGSFAPTSLTLTQGDNYQFTVSHTVTQSETQVTVPEPATLALLGSGLLGFGAVRRFRKA